ncbi:MAG TPA: glycosyltransferase family 2 protein [Anaerolineaceae bacterium]|mgnify:CR=1 FL=1|nr:glycosyltransferase family 2 protein [Anaerolineaceae bacterium]HPN52295.1 glycosyltransferase family 2 protein [Anaerolineaceae bacterium]
MLLKRLKKLWTLIRREGFFSAAHLFYSILGYGLQKRALRFLNRWQKQLYPGWRARHQRRLARLPRVKTGPLFSIYLPGSGPGAALTLDSLRAQVYPNWEAWVSGPEIPIRDARIHLISDGLPALNGSFAAWLEPGDALAPAALNRLAAALERQDADVIYFDEEFPAAGGGWQPLFKPDFSPELLLSTNYLRGAFTRTALFQQHFADPETLTWRLVEHGARICHLPELLYRRSRPENPSGRIPAAAQHLARLGLQRVKVELSGGQIRASWATAKKVTIVIPTRNNLALLRRCLDSLFAKTRYPHFEVVLVDNASTDPAVFAYYDRITAEKKVRVLKYTDAFNFSAYCNRGAAQSERDVVLFLNNDVEIIDPAWLEQMVQWFELPETGMVGARLLYPDGTLQHAGVVIGLEGHAGHVFNGLAEGASGVFGSAGWYRNYLTQTAACVALRRGLFEQVGGFDERYLLVFNDMHLGLKVVKAGFRVIHTPFARLIHYEGKSRAKYNPPEDIRLGCEHARAWAQRGDPFFNPNLSYIVSTPMIRWLPEDPPLLKLEKITRFFG